MSEENNLEEEIETVPVEEEFLGHLKGVQDLQNRLNKLSGKLGSDPNRKVSAGELAGILGILAGDFAELLKDTINSSQSLFVESFELLSGSSDEVDDDSGSGGDAGETPDAEAVQLYATFQANVVAFEGMLSSAKEGADKSGAESMIAMNKSCMVIIEEQVGSAVKTEAEKWLAEAAKNA